MNFMFIRTFLEAKKASQRLYFLFISNKIVFY